MWYLKKTASSVLNASESVWNASKNLIDKRTPIQKLIDSIANSQQQIIPTNKLTQLSSLTYSLETFDEIVKILLERLKKFYYDVEESQKTLNLLVAVNYIIKHGASGFVDVFRQYIGVFKKYQELKVVKTYEDFIIQSKLDDNLQKIKSRAHHISELLEDKNKLLKQKELSMLVKQKLKLYEKNKLSDLNIQQYSNKQSREKGKIEQSTQAIKNLGSKAQNLIGNPQELSQKLQGLLQAYVWKYVDKIDETIESASQKIMVQIDKYVKGEQPHPFQAEEIQNFQQYNASEKPKPKDDDDDLMQQLEKQSKNATNENIDLLDLNERIPKQKQTQDLI